MPNVSEKKKKLLYLLEILWKETDEQHALTLPQMLQKLEEKGIHAERKSLYDDIETLRSFGINIEKKKSRTFQYFISTRTFSREELKLLADAVRNSPGLTKKAAAELVEKLGTLCSEHQAGELSQKAQPAEKGSEEKLVLEFSASLLETVEDRFGSGLKTEPGNKNKLRATIKTRLEPDFFPWLFSLGTEIKLLSPKKLAEQFRERAKAVSKLYKS